MPVVLSDSSDDSVTSKPWFWVLVVGLPLLLLSSLAFALWFLLFRKQRKGSEEENAPRHHAPGPPNPMQFKSPLRTGPMGVSPLRDGNGHFPLVSALKGPGSPKPPIGSPKRAVTFSAFHTGEKVEGYFEDKWYQAVIQSHNVDGTYTVLWLPDHAMTSVVTAQQLRRLNLSQGGTSYAMSDYDYYETEGDSMVGTLVQCLWQQEWHTGTVEVVNPDGTYLIRYVLRARSHVQEPTTTLHKQTGGRTERIPPTSIAQTPRENLETLLKRRKPHAPFSVAPTPIALGIEAQVSLPLLCACSVVERTRRLRSQRPCTPR